MYSVQSLNIEGQGAQNAIDVTTVGLYLAAAVAALTGLVGMGIALSSEIGLTDADQPTLRALGVRLRVRVIAAATVGVPVALVGSVLALGGAALASPLFPLGVAADAEPDPGFRLDGVALAGRRGRGAARRAPHRGARGDPHRPRGRVGARAGPSRHGRPRRLRAGAPPPLAAGTRFALDPGRSRPSLPVRSSLLGATFGSWSWWPCWCSRPASITWSRHRWRTAGRGHHCR